MSNQSGKKRGAWLRSGTLVLAVILILPAAYVFFYYRNNEVYLTNYYFRSLSDIEKQINLGLKGLDYLLDYALADLPQAKESAGDDNDSGSKETVKSFCQDETTRTFCTEYLDYLKKYSLNFKNIKFFRAMKSCEGPQENIDGSDTTCFALTQQPGNHKVVVYEKEGEIAARVPLKDLIDPAPALEFFDQVLLLDKDGNLIYRSGDDDIRQSSNYTAYDDFARFENLVRHLEMDEKRSYDSKTKTLVTEKVKSRSSYSSVREAMIGNVTYKLFIQPFQAVRAQQGGMTADDGQDEENGDGDAKGAGKIGYIVGIIPKDKYSFKAIELPLSWVTLLVFGMLIIILLIPHLKLFFSGPGFMPGRVFVWCLAASFPLLVMVTLTGVFSALEWVKLRESFDLTAQTIVKRISDNFEDEYENLLGRQDLKDFMRLLNPGPYQNRVIPSYQHKLSACIKVNEKEKGTGKCLKAETPSGVYPPYELLFVLDKDGRGLKDTEKEIPGWGNIIINEQVTYRKFPIINVDVHRREYFKEARYNSHALPAWPTGTERRPFYSQRIQTYDHGIKLTALSFPLADACTEGQACVLTLVKLMHTFFEPVLPMGFGFAVVEDRSGDVLYHSNDQRSLLENFYIETDENRQLIAAIHSRQERSVDGKYQGYKHRFYVKPLPNVPWSVVVYYDLNVPDLLNFKTAVVSLSWICLLAFALYVPFLIPYVRHKAVDYAKGWLPNGHRIHKVHEWTLRSRWFGRYRFSSVYIGFHMIILVAFSALVVVFIHGFVDNHQIEKLAHLNLIHVADELTERHTRLQSEFDRLNIALSDQEPRFRYWVPKEKEGMKPDLFEFAVYMKDRLGMKRCIKPGAKRDKNETRPSCKTYQEVKNSHDHGWSSNVTEALLPNISDLDARLNQMLFERGDDGKYLFFEGPCEKDMPGRCIFLQYQPHQEQAGYRISAPADPIAKLSVFKFFEGKPKHLLLFSFFLFVLLIYVYLLVLYYLIKQVALTLFGLDFPSPQKWEERVTAHCHGHHYPVDIYPASAKERQRIKARRNLDKIITDESGDLLEMKSILFSKSHRRFLNTRNVNPLMWLYHGGIFKFEDEAGSKKGLLVFADPKMEQWIKEQPWDAEIVKYHAHQESNFWRILAAPFYSALVLAGIFLVLSGSEVLNLFLTLASIIVAGGLPFLGEQLFRTRHD